VLDGTNQAPIGVKPEPSQSNHDCEQKANQEDLAAASPPEKEAESRRNNHCDRVDDRYPRDGVFAYDGTMIKANLDKNDTESCHQDEYNCFVKSRKFRRKENVGLRMQTFKRENQLGRVFSLGSLRLEEEPAAIQSATGFSCNLFNSSLRNWSAALRVVTESSSGRFVKRPSCKRIAATQVVPCR
jgi:hypothetical protein